MFEYIPVLQLSNLLLFLWILLLKHQHLLLCLLYCNLSCCPLTASSCYNSQASTYRANYTISDQVTPEVNTAADLARLRDEGRTLNVRELKELTTRIKALEEMAQLEDHLRTLERKRHRSADTEDQLEHQLDSHEPKRSATERSVNPERSANPERSVHPECSANPERSANLSGSLGQHAIIRHSIESDDSESSSSDTIQHRHKQQRYTKGIKVIPSYTLKISSSL